MQDEELMEELCPAGLSLSQEKHSLKDNNFNSDSLSLDFSDNAAKPNPRKKENELIRIDDN